jgi:HAD superfamily hydrolase (TIGR01509 family)
VSDVEAVIFDLDGVLLDSEQAWDEARKDLVAETGGTWKDSATRDMMGMSSREWPVYVRDELHVPMTTEEINADIVRRMVEGYRRELPLLPGAKEAVERIAARWPIGLASSSNREVIDEVLRDMGVEHLFTATVSSEEVERGKPAPDVYAETARQMRVDPTRTVAIEDSENGIRSARAAGMRVLAVPNPHFPPAAEALAEATVLADLAALTPDAVEGR